jgi:hypothetical protein
MGAYRGQIEPHMQQAPSMQAIQRNCLNPPYPYEILGDNAGATPTVSQ